MSWDVTDDVGGFINGSYTNYGWIIKDTTAHSGYCAVYPSYSNFDSKEGTNKPQLVITYSTPLQPIPELTPFGLLVVVGILVLAVKKISR